MIKKLVHGDVHDGNILFKKLSPTTSPSAYHFKLADLGACQKQGLCREQAVALFMAPEISTFWTDIFPGHLQTHPRVEPTTDIWSWSATIIRLALLPKFQTVEGWLEELARTSEEKDLETVKKAEKTCLIRMAEQVTYLQLHHPWCAITPEELLFTLVGCHSLLPKDRPTAAEIDQRLQPLASKLPAPRQSLQPTSPAPCVKSTYASRTD